MATVILLIYFWSATSGGGQTGASSGALSVPVASMEECHERGKKTVKAAEANGLSARYECKVEPKN